MKTFQALAFRKSKCRKELQDLRRLLRRRSTLSEKVDIIPFFQARPHLAAYCGFYHNHIAAYDLIAWEYDLFGDFACDLVVGDARKKAFCFIEFEDGGPKSLFVREGRKATRAWSPRFEHGYSQIVDWFYKLIDRRNSDDFEARFGKRSIDFMGLLIVGRDHFLEAGERARLEWRREHSVVHSKRIHCVTYDELLDDLTARLANVI